MATPLSADRLLAALRAEGVEVVEYRSWRTHNRNGAGAWGPVHGVMVHHTVTKGADSSVRLCYEGRSDLPGPLCHGVIAKDGTVYLVGHGRANHAGAGDGDVLQAVIDERSLPADKETDTDGNRHFYGFEAVNLGDGKDPWPAAQVEAVVRASAAICRAHGWGRDGDTSVIGHLEWQPGKVDPRGPGITMPDVRRRVAERLTHPPSWSPGTPTTPEEDDMPTAQEIARAVWTTDGIIPAAPEAQAGGNEYVSGATWLTYLGARDRQILTELAAQRATIQQLAQALAERDEQIDVDALVTRIETAIEGVTVRLDTTP
jgi:hypothetical protein